MVELLLNSQLFRHTDICQFQFGSPAVKPTRLLYANMPLEELMQAYARRDFVRPVTVLAGRTADGKFATSVAKQYPRLLNMAFGMATMRHLPQVNAQLTAEQDELVKRAHQWSHFCKGIRGVQNPDYQPRAVALHV